MGGQTISTSETRIEAFKVQSSAYGVVIPLVFGVTRITGNLIWYGGFKAIPHTTKQGGKGGGVKTQNTTYTYTASVAMGLCHGSVTDIPRVWRGKKLFSGGTEPSGVATATETFTVPASGAMEYTLVHASSWLNMVSVSGVTQRPPNYSDSTQLLSEGRAYVYADGKLTIRDEQWREKPITVRYQYAAGSTSTSALDQLGLTFKRGEIGQAEWSALSAYPAQNIAYSGLAYVGGQDYDLGSGAQIENHLFEVVGPLAYSLGPTVPDVDPSLMLRQVLINDRAGASFPSAQLGDWQAWSDYAVATGLLVSPALTEQATAAETIRITAQLGNAGPVWSDGQLKMVPYGDEAVTGNGRTYTPNTVPVYELDDECYTPADEGEPPVKVRLKSPAERYNHVRIEFLNRALQYNTDIAEAKDQADIEDQGLRSKDIVRAHWICDAAVARQVAQIMLQRSLYVAAEYDFSLPWHYALLEPMDLVTLADARQQMDAVPTRVTVIEEDEEGGLTVTAEDYPPGIASAALYDSQPSEGYAHDYNLAPGNVSAPVIFEAPAALSSTGLEVYAAVRSGSASWGGCQVWVSLDGTNYKQVGIVAGAARMGTVAAAVGVGDATVQVQGLLGEQLLNATAADAAAAQTLCWLGSADPEFIAYQGAALTGAGAYTLTGVQRALYATPTSAHASGEAFVRVDERMAKSGALELANIGRTIYFKFPSFNIHGWSQQTLAEVPAYTYQITGRELRRQSRSLGIKINTSSFGGAPGSNYNEAYIHGVDATGEPIDRPGQIVLNGKNVAVPNGVVFSNLLFPKGWIIWDSTGSARFITLSGNTHFAIVKREGGRWYWDANGGIFGEIALLPTDYVIGTVEINDTDDDNPPGISRATMLAVAMSPEVLVGLGDTAVWDQVAGKPRTWRAVSSGLNAQGLPYPAGVRDAETGDLVLSQCRSWSLVVIRCSDDGLLLQKYYDVYAEGTDPGNDFGGGRGPYPYGSAALAGDLNYFNANFAGQVWLLVITGDEPFNNHNNNGLPAALKRAGARQSTLDMITFRGAYLLLGLAGCGEGGAIYEGVRGTPGPAAGPTDAFIDLMFQTFKGGVIGVSAADGGVNAALSLAANAKATADGKIDTFYQPSPPGSAGEGDLWFDTDDGNRVYVRSAYGTWEPAADTRIATAINNAAGAQATADGKVTTYYTPYAPGAGAVGDLWFNTANGRSFRWNGGSWVLVTTVGAGDITTPLLDPSAATDPLTATYSQGTWTNTSAGILASVDYTNNTGRTVKVEGFSAVSVGYDSYANSYVNGVAYPPGIVAQMRAQLFFSDGSPDYSRTRTLGNQEVKAPLGMDFAKVSPVYFLAPGERVIIDLGVYLSGSTATYTAKDAVTRANVIKA